MTFEGAELEALEEGRRVVGIELNSAFIAMAEYHLQTARCPLGFEDSNTDFVPEPQLSFAPD